MNWISKLSLRASVLTFVAIGLASALAMSAMMFWQTMRAADLERRMVASVQLTRAAGTADMMHDALRATTYHAMLTGAQGSADEKKAVADELAEFTKTLAKAMDNVQAAADSGDLRAALAEVKPLVERYTRTAADLVAAALADGGANEARKATFAADFKRLEEKLEAMSELIEQRAEAAVKDAEAELRVALVLIVAMLLAAVVVLGGFGWIFQRTLMRRVGAEPAALRNFAALIAKGELHTELSQAELPENSIAAAMLGMRNKLREAVAEIREGAEGVAQCSVQIAGSSQELNDRSSRQGGQLQTAAASMEQMTGSVKQTAEHARQASQLADEASQIAQRGGESVRRVVQTMGQIQESSRRIADIINVIDGIAFQTNILALNAAVEAARAGEQGRGFAVVAGEVRNLAQRSAGAAREIKALITSSVETVEGGHQTVLEAGSTMDEIVAGVKRVTDLIGEIRVASSEQDLGIAQVSQSVAALDNDTRGNGGLVEQTAGAAASLQAQAERLARSVAAFRLQAG